MRNDTVNETCLEIVESTYVVSEDGKGMVLRCLARALEGADASRLAHLDFTLEHDDPRIQDRGQLAFSGLRRAVGVLAPEDSGELHWKPFRVKLHADGPVQYLFDGEPAELRRAA